MAFAILILVAGQTVLDLGSGGGIDVIRVSKLVGPSGRVIGVDSTPEMIFKAREKAEKYGYEERRVQAWRNRTPANR